MPSGARRGFDLASQLLAGAAVPSAFWATGRRIATSNVNVLTTGHVGSTGGGGGAGERPRGL